jgi:hypothetical protein
LIQWCVQRTVMHDRVVMLRTTGDTIELVPFGPTKAMPSVSGASVSSHLPHCDIVLVS